LAARKAGEGADVAAGVWDCCVMAAFSVVERREEMGGSRPILLFMIIFVVHCTLP